MIKCDGFLKLLKQLFFISLIGFFGLFVNSSVNASFDSQGYYYSSNVVSVNVFQDYAYSLDTRGNFNTFSINDNTSVNAFVRNPNMEGTKNLFSLSWLNGDLYFSNRYVYGNNNVSSSQGFLRKWCIAPVSSRNQNGGYLHYNCSYNKTLNEVKYAFNGYDGYAFMVGGSISPSWAGYDFHTLQFCFSDGVNDYCVECGSAPGSGCPSGLTGSLGLNLGDFTNISNYNWGSSPFQIHGTNDVFNSGSINIIEGDYTYTYCTYGEVLRELENEGYNEYLCYGGLSDWSDFDSSGNYNNAIPGTGFRLSEILSHNLQNGQTPQEWFDFWNGLYYDDNFVSMWESYPAVNRTWFTFYKYYGGDRLYFDGVREYCNIKVDYVGLDLDSKFPNSNMFFGPECQKVIRAKNSGTYDSSGNVVLGVNWNGVGNMGTSIKTNPVEAIQDFFNKLRSNITTDYFGLGFLPQYIIFFLLAIILFRFVGH